MSEKYSDNELDIIYSMGKKTDHLEFLYSTKYEDCYMMGEDIYLFKNRDKDATDFKIYNISFLYRCNEPMVEITVVPKEASITISSFYIENKTKHIKAKYDDIKKNWEVRDYIEGNERLTDIDKALNNLGKIDIFGTEIKEKTTSIFDLSKKIFDKFKGIRKTR